MFLVFGLLLAAGLFLTALYFFVFRYLQYTINIVILIIVSLIPLIAPSMHTVILSMIMLAAGSFLIKIAKEQRQKKTN
jgi:hypothetical protein